jgi:dTMP kinase
MPFITFEGIEGSGKSTQALRLAQAIGPEAVLTFEPGATPVGRRIREVLLDRSLLGVVEPEAELLLFLADRVQHVGEVIRPALDAGKVVLCDRFADSTLAYQGYGRGLSIDRILESSRAALGDLSPDLTLLFDIPVEAGLRRAGRRGNNDRFEAETVSFHERVREGFRTLAAGEPARFAIIDAAPDADTVARAVREAVATRGILKHALL